MKAGGVCMLLEIVKVWGLYALIALPAAVVYYRDCKRKLAKGQ